MTTIIMIFILPIGIVIYFWDKKNYQEALELFENYILNVKHSGLSENEMIKKIKTMFYKNDYQILHHKDRKSVV